MCGNENSSSGYLTQMVRDMARGWHDYVAGLWSFWRYPCGGE